MSAGLRFGAMSRGVRTGATALCLSLLLPVVAGSQVLSVPLVVQEQSEWCWAAVSSAVLGYYKKPLSQCEIAEYTRTKATWHDYGQVNCCTSPSGTCNYWNYNWGYPGSIQDILQNNGIDNAGNAGALTLAQIKTEVAARRPFVIRWAWTAGGGHFIVGSGVADSTVYYMNPWPGEGAKISDYAWLVSNSEHSWQGTNTMKTTPVVGVARSAVAAPLRVSGRMTSAGLVVSWSPAGETALELRAHSPEGRLVGSVRIDPKVSQEGALLLPDWHLASGATILSLQAGEASARAVVFLDR